MSISKLRSSTAVDKALGIAAVDQALRINVEDTQADGRSQDAALGNGAITAEHVSTYLRGISGNSTDEIDSLISDLRGLREKLVADGCRIEQEVMKFATLNQSVIKLAEVISNSVAQVKGAQSH